MSQNPVAPRQKEYHEIMWVQKGSSTFIIDGDVFELKASAFFIIPKTRIHQFIPSQEVEGQVIRFTEDELIDFPRLIFSKFNSISEITLTPSDIEQFDLLFKSVDLEWQNAKRDGSFIVALIALIIKKIDAIKQKQLSVNKKNNTRLDILDKFQILLDDFIHEKKTVSFYAEQLHITPRKLDETIKSIFNHTAAQLISQRLIIEAKRSLMYSNTSIYNIAYTLGFKDNSHFSKFFKSHCGITPKAYRQNHNL